MSLPIGKASRRSNVGTYGNSGNSLYAELMGDPFNTRRLSQLSQGQYNAAAANNLANVSMLKPTESPFMWAARVERNLERVCAYCGSATTTLRCDSCGAPK